MFIEKYMLLYADHIHLIRQQQFEYSENVCRFAHEVWIDAAIISRPNDPNRKIKTAQEKNILNAEKDEKFASLFSWQTSADESPMSHC